MTTRTARCSCGQLRLSRRPTLFASPFATAGLPTQNWQLFAAQARFPASSVPIAGASNTFVRVGDARSRSTFHFCPTCGATVYYTSEDREDSIVIPVGAFADPAFPAPTFSVYAERI